MRWLGHILQHWWATLGLGALIGALLSDGLKRLGAAVIAFFINRHDQVVWESLSPRYAPSPEGVVVGGHPRPAPDPIPYKVPEIAANVTRRERSVISSLRRLEKRGKARETHEGWLWA
jgi:hypothetical protein